MRQPLKSCIQDMKQEESPHLSALRQSLQSDYNLYRFCKHPTVLDLSESCSTEQKQHLQELPESFLYLAFEPELKIYLSDQNGAKLVFQSPFTAQFIQKTIRKVIARECPQDNQLSWDELVQKIWKEGDSTKADTLIRDLVGQENCGFLGLPPKLIAFSLKKTGHEFFESSTYDRLQSLLVAFAINTASFIKQQCQITKVRTVLMTPGILHPGLLQTHQAVLGAKGELWFTQPKQSA